MPPQEQGTCQIHCIAIKRAIAGCFKPVCTGGAKQFDNLGSKQVIAVICITVSPCHLHPHPQHPHIFFCISIKDLHVTPGHCLAPLHPCQCLLVSPPTGPHPHVPAGSQPATMSPCHASCIPTFSLASCDSCPFHQEIHKFLFMACTSLYKPQKLVK